MKVALYHPWIHTKGGVERVVLEILKKSKHDVDVYCSSYKSKNTFKDFKNYNIKTKLNIPIKGYLFRGGSFFLATSLTKLPLKKYDIFLVSTAGIGEFITFRNHEIPTISYCHTPLRTIHDPSFRRRKLENMNPLKKPLYKFGMRFYSFFEKRAWKHFNHVIANSKNTKQRMIKGELFPKNKIDVIHPGVNLEDFTPSETYKKYFFYPSRFAPYKRQDLAIRSFLEFKKKTDKNFKLVLAGSVGEGKKEYFNKIKEMADDHEDIKVKKNVPSKEWLRLYREAYTILFTAMNEDWGIIPIEAGACKKPVIAVDEGGPRESVVDGKSGFLVEANPNSISKAMVKLAKDKELVKQMGKRGLRESKKYSWEKFVNKLDKKLEEFK